MEPADGDGDAGEEAPSDDVYVFVREAEAPEDGAPVEFELSELAGQLRDVSEQVRQVLLAQGTQAREAFLMRLLQALRHFQNFASRRIQKKNEAHRARGLPLPVADLLLRGGHLPTILELVKLALNLAEPPAGQLRRADEPRFLRLEALWLLRLLSVFLTQKAPLIDEGVAELVCNIVNATPHDREVANCSFAALQNLCFFRFREGSRNPDQRRVISAGAFEVLLAGHERAVGHRDGHEMFQIELSLANLLMEKGTCLEIQRSPQGSGPPQRAVAILDRTVQGGTLLNLEPSELDRLFGHWIGLQSMVPLLSSGLLPVRLLGVHCLHNLAKVEKYIRSGQLWRDLALNEGIQPLRRMLWEAEAQAEAAASLSVSAEEGGSNLMQRTAVLVRDLLEQLNVHPHEEQRPLAPGESHSFAGGSGGSGSHEHELGCHFAALRTDPTLEALCDLVLVVPPVGRFRVHRCMVMARSAMLRGMLTGGFREDGQAEVELGELSGMSPEGFALVLEYMYTGALVLPTELAAEVLHAADVLLLPGLRVRCEELLSQYVDHETVLELLRIADAYRCTQLLRRALTFAQEHSAAVERQVAASHSQPLPPHLRERLTAALKGSDASGPFEAAS